MKRYQVVKGLNLTADDRPVIELTPEGLAMGSVPGWEVFLDPDFASPASARNRAKYGSVGEILKFGSLPPDPIGEFAGGQTAFVASEERRIAIETFPNIDPANWSVFSVVQAGEAFSAGGATTYICSYRGHEAGALSLSIGWPRAARNAINVYERAESTAVRLGYSVDLTNEGGPRLIMVTFGTSTGLKIYDGGVLVAENASDRRPLERFDPSTRTSWFSNGHARAGMSGILNIDLGALENSGHRRSIEKFLMSKYAIT